MQIVSNKVVSIDYTLTNAAGKVLDSSQGRAPLTYVHGARSIIPGLERELEGKAPGDKLNVTIPAADAFGERDPKMIQPVSRDVLKGVTNLQPGMQLQAQAPNGMQRIVTVVNVEPDRVVIDANHPLAGMPLTFDVTVVDVRDPTEEEQSGGQAQGGAGDGH